MSIISPVHLAARQLVVREGRVDARLTREGGEIGAITVALYHGRRRGKPCFTLCVGGVRPILGAIWQTRAIIYNSVEKSGAGQSASCATRIAIGGSRVGRQRIVCARQEAASIAGRGSARRCSVALPRARVASNMRTGILHRQLQAGLSARGSIEGSAIANSGGGGQLRLHPRRRIVTQLHHALVASGGADLRDDARGRSCQVGWKLDVVFRINLNPAIEEATHERSTRLFSTACPGRGARAAALTHRDWLERVVSSVAAVADRNPLPRWLPDEGTGSNNPACLHAPNRTINQSNTATTCPSPPRRPHSALKRISTL